MADQPQPAESTVESRLEAFFGGKPAEAAAPEEPPIDEQEPASETAPDGQADEAPDEAAEAPEETPPQYEEVEWDGKKYAVDPALKPAIMKSADYTQKTQELAAIRKAIEAEKFVMAAQKTFEQQVQPLLDQQQQLRSYKEQAKKIDWTALTTDQKIDLDRELRNIDSQLSDLDKQLDQGKEKHKQAFSQAVVQAVQATEQYMSNKVPGWNQAAGNSLHEYGLQLGIPREKLTSGYFSDPQATLMMWKAQQWDTLQAGKPQIQNKASVAPPVNRPGSNAAQQSVKQSRYQQARAQLKKSGSVEDAAALFLQRMK